MYYIYTYTRRWYIIYYKNARGDLCAIFKIPSRAICAKKRQKEKKTETEDKPTLFGQQNVYIIGGG